MSDSPYTGRLIRHVLLLIVFAAGAVFAGDDHHHGNATGELATYMGELQRLTHKLSLSTRAGNAPLSGFYLHESLAMLEQMQEEVPEYQNLPIAVYIDRLGLPAYETLDGLLDKDLSGDSAGDMQQAMDEIIDSCNECHRATQHGFIKIIRPESNPFNQDFTP